MPEATFTCPECGAVSHHPDDARFGYCGRCHAFTGEPTDFVLHGDEAFAERTRDNLAHRLDRVAGGYILHGRTDAQWQRDMADFWAQERAALAIHEPRSFVSLTLDPPRFDYAERRTPWWRRLWRHLSARR